MGFRKTDPKDLLCPCCSGLEYKNCCKPFHDGGLPETPLQLMRSRYSAYSKQLAKYIVDTTHPANQTFQNDKTAWMREILRFCKITQFLQLEIIDSENGETEGYVTFTAHLKQDNRNATFTEKSRFLKENVRWLYVDGIVTNGNKDVGDENS